MEDSNLWTSYPPFNVNSLEDCSGNTPFLSCGYICAQWIRTKISPKVTTATRIQSSVVMSLFNNVFRLVEDDPLQRPMVNLTHFINVKVPD